MPKTLTGFLMAAATTLIVLAVASRVEAIRKLVGLNPPGA